MASLFETYGGFASVRRIVSAFYDRAVESEILAPYFEGVDMRRLIDHQTKFIAQAMGGPVSYTDHELERVHSRLHITEAAFDEMHNLLRETLEDSGVRNEDVEAVCGQIVARRVHIVTKR